MYEITIYYMSGISSRALPKKVSFIFQIVISKSYMLKWEGEATKQVRVYAKPWNFDGVSRSAFQDLSQICLSSQRKKKRKTS